MTAAPGKLTSSVGAVYKPVRFPCSSRWAATRVRHRSSGRAQSALPNSLTPQVEVTSPATMRPAVAASGHRLTSGHTMAGGAETWAWT